MLERIGGPGAPSDLIFPSSAGTPLATATTGRILARLGISGTTHGWRSVCRDVMVDELDVSDEMAEFVLGHVRGGLIGAYRRGTALARRVIAMEAWATWLGGGSSV